MNIGHAEFVGNFKHGTPEWHEARQAVVGSSDIGIILGLSHWKSPFTLWHEKQGLVAPAEPDERTKRKHAYGHHMEPFIAGLFAERHPDLVVQEAGSYRHRDRTWQGCNPDRLVAKDGYEPHSVIELKTFPSLSEWFDGPPPLYVAQLLWQMDTFGFARGYIAGYANLSGDYVEYEFEADPFAAEAARVAALDFFQSPMPPEIDGSRGTYETLRQLNPSLNRGEEKEIPADVATAYLEAQAGFKAADSELNKWKGHLLAHMGTAQYARFDERKIASRVAVKDAVPYLKEA